MLRTTIQQDQITALKTGDKKKLDILRFILAQIKNKEVDKKSELDDLETITVLQKLQKELIESIEAFQKGNRQDLAADSQAQLEIVKSYLPKEISDAELKIEIERIKAANIAAYQQNPKALIGLCMKALRTKASSTRILKILMEYVA